MTPETKKVVKVILITTGIVLVVGGITLIIYLSWKKSHQEESSEENPYVKANKKPTSSSSSSSSTSHSSAPTNVYNGVTYTVSEIKRMQSYLLHMGAILSNEYIVGRIQNTGGIDGKIGTGFKEALLEAIKIDLVTDITHLLSRANIYSNL